MGRGHISDHLIIWAGAVRPKTEKKKKCVTDGRTRLDGGTDGSTDKGAAYERLKSAKKKREEGVEVYDINKVVDKA